MIDSNLDKRHMLNRLIISRSIDILRFPLILAVIYIHSTTISDENFALLEAIRNIISNTVCHIAVPLFFLISGYLFFINVNEFNLKVYIKKLKSRFKTLVVPYVFWNTIVVLFIAIGQVLLPSFFSGAFKSVTDFSFEEWISVFWSVQNSGEPISFQLWFLRDLIVMIFLTPVFYYLGRYLKWILVLGLIIFRLSGFDIYVTGFSSVAISFFGVGATLGIMKFERINPTKLKIISLTIIYIALIVIEQFYMDATWHGFVHRFDVILGCILVFEISFLMAKKNFEINGILTKSSFFIYCYHVLFIMIFGRLLKKLSIFNNELSAIVVYLITPIIVATVGVFLYYLLNKTMPRYLKLISGGR